MKESHTAMIAIGVIKKLEAIQQEKEITDDLYTSTQLPKWDEIWLKLNLYSWW